MKAWPQALGVLDKVARVALAHLVVFELIAIDDLDGAVEPPDDVEVRVDRDDPVPLDYRWGANVHVEFGSGWKYRR